jgi:cytoskeletal protein CcmA (bactofilin family)
MLVLGAFLVAMPVQALILNSEENLVFNDYVTEDVYLAGGTVTLEQDIEGDLVVAGGDVTLNGKVSGDVWIAGGTVRLNAEVGDDVRLVGGSLLLNAAVKGDLIALGGSVDQHPTASVEGDVVLLAWNANLYGTVNRSLQGIANRLMLGGAVHGNVDVRVTEQLVLLKGSTIDGNLIYFSPQAFEDHGGAIGGTTSFNSIESHSDRIEEGLRKWLNRGALMGAFLSFLSLLLIGGLMVALFPNLLHRTSESIHCEPLKNFGMGFLVFVLGGFAAALLLFTFVGVPLAFMGLAFLFIVGELGRVVLAYGLIARFIKSPRRGAPGRDFVILALGLLVFKLLTFIPYVGWPLGFVFLLIGTGALVRIQRMNFQQLRKEKLV